MGVVPTDVLSKHRPEEQCPDAEDLGLRRVVEAGYEEVAGDQVYEANDGSSCAESWNFRIKCVFVYDGEVPQITLKQAAS